MAAGKWELQINAVLLKFGVIKEGLQEDAAEELESTLQDYHDLAAQYSDMLTTFCYEDKPVRKNMCGSAQNVAKGCSTTTRTATGVAKRWAGTEVRRKGEGNGAGNNAWRTILRERRF